MSDRHDLPLKGHDLITRPVVRARVFRAGADWFWSYKDHGGVHPLRHGPYLNWSEAFASARRMVELL